MPVVGSATFPVFGTGALVLTAQRRALAPAVASVHHVCAEIDAACSGFREDSDVERVNAGAGGWVPVGSLFCAVLSEALRVAAATAGDVDPTVGEAMHAIGYDRDFALVPAAGPAGIAFRRAPGYAVVDVDARSRRARIPRGTRLDLGATAKAYAADRTATAAAAAAGCGVLVSLGGDIAVAGAAPAEGWDIGLSDWYAGPVETGHSVTIRSGALATSSTTVRRWRRGRGVVHHIVDPRTGRPAAEVWRTVSVAAATCVDANAASTAAIVRGHRAPAWLEGLGLPARLVHADGSIVRTSGWPREAAA